MQNWNSFLQQIISLRENLAEKEKEIEELWERMFNLEKDYLCLKQLYETDLAARHALRESRLNFRAARLKNRMDQLEYDRAGNKCS